MFAEYVLNILNEIKLVSGVWRSRRPDKHNCKTDHFSSLIGREHLWNVQKIWKCTCKYANSRVLVNVVVPGCLSSLLALGFCPIDIFVQSNISKGYRPSAQAYVICFLCASPERLFLNCRAFLKELKKIEKKCLYCSPFFCFQHSMLALTMFSAF